MIFPALTLNCIVREGKTLAEVCVGDGVPIRGSDLSICAVTIHPYIISTGTVHYPVTFWFS